MPETDEVDDEAVVEQPETEVEAPESEEAEDTPEAEEGAESTEEGEETPAPTRRENRVQALARRTREAEDRALRAETERDALKNTRSSPAINPEESRRVRDEKLALMDPQERRDFLRDEELKELKNGMAMTRFQMQDSLDKNSFDAEVNSNPALAKMKGEVEKMYADALSKGTFVPRLSLLDYVIGKQAREKLKQPAGKAATAAKKAAGERVGSVTTKPMSGKSDTTGKAAASEREARMARIEAAERQRGVRD